MVTTTKIPYVYPAIREIKLNAPVGINNAAKHLEIGVNKGNRFNWINGPGKVAVDPRFQFETGTSPATLMNLK